MRYKTDIYLYIFSLNVPWYLQFPWRHRRTNASVSWDFNNVLTFSAAFLCSTETSQNTQPMTQRLVPKSHRSSFTLLVGRKLCWPWIWMKIRQWSASRHKVLEAAFQGENQSEHGAEHSPQVLIYFSGLAQIQIYLYTYIYTIYIYIYIYIYIDKFITKYCSIIHERNISITLKKLL